MTAALLSQPHYQVAAPQHKIGKTFKIIQSHGEQVRHIHLQQGCRIKWSANSQTVHTSDESTSANTALQVNGPSGIELTISK